MCWRGYIFVSDYTTIGARGWLVSQAPTGPTGPNYHMYVGALIKPNWPSIQSTEYSVDRDEKFETYLYNSNSLKKGLDLPISGKRRFNAMIIRQHFSPSAWKMLGFMDYVQNAFYEASHWNRDNSYGSLEDTARSNIFLPFAPPPFFLKKIF